MRGGGKRYETSVTANNYVKSTETCGIDVGFCKGQFQEFYFELVLDVYFCFGRGRAFCAIPDYHISSTFVDITTSTLALGISFSWVQDKSSYAISLDGTAVFSQFSVSSFSMFCLLNGFSCSNDEANQWRPLLCIFLLVSIQFCLFEKKKTQIYLLA